MSKSVEHFPSAQLADGEGYRLAEMSGGPWAARTSPSNLVARLAEFQAERVLFGVRHAQAV
jgi:hypothetical protein